MRVSSSLTQKARLANCLVLDDPTISGGEWPEEFDPYKLDDELRSIVVSHGGTYFDILADFRAIPNAERYYSPIDGHPDARGHALISDFRAKELTGGAVRHEERPPSNSRT